MSRLAGWRAKLLGEHSQATLALATTAVLFAAGAIASPGSVGLSALSSMLPFAAILAIAAIGQQVVILQRGLDLSAPGIISVAAVATTILPTGPIANSEVLGLAWPIAGALGLAILAGLANGIAIVVLAIPPLVATIGVNSLLYGLVLAATGGTPSAAPTYLSAFALDRTLGIPNTALVAILFAAAMIFVIGRTVLGRRFMAVGISPVAALAASIRVPNHVLGAYLVAGLCYGVAGVLLAGLLNVPSLFVGGPYLLATVAAVVLGGSPLAGGRGSVLATLLGALFITQLGQILVTLGIDRSVQFVCQGLIVLVGTGLQERLGLGQRARGAA